MQAFLEAWTIVVLVLALIACIALLRRMRKARKALAEEVAAQRDAERRLRETEARYRTLVEQLPLHIYIDSLDEQHATIYASPQIERMLGYSAEQWLEDPDLFSKILHPEDRPRVLGSLARLAEQGEPFAVEYRAFRRDGQLVWLHDQASVVSDAEGRPQHIQGYIVDITRRKEAEEALSRQVDVNRHQALHDALTGLPNRLLFHERIEHAIVSARARDDKIAVLMVDLDRFKEINDTLGHRSGDLLLTEVAGRLRSAVRATDTVARLGGDEFGLLLGLRSADALLDQTLERILRAIKQPVVIEGLPLSVEASVGIALYPEHGDSVDVLLQRADIAMYEAKEQSAVSSVYDAAADDHRPERLTILGELRSAIDRGELTLYYQPKAELPSGAVTSVEAVVRWRHPTRGLIPPDDFVPFAETTGLIKPLTRWVIDEALRQRQEWAREGHELVVAVNASARNLVDPDFPHDVAALLAKWKVDASQLRVEITESAIIVDPLRIKNALQRLDAMGVRLAIDDFGTGYSSLAYLNQLPISQIKIDRMFVTDMLEDVNKAVIVQSVIDLGRNLGLRVVAEGVETTDVWRRLIQLECAAVQGYGLSPPLPPDELPRWLAEQGDAAKPAGLTATSIVGSPARIRLTASG